MNGNVLDFEKPELGFYKIEEIAHSLARICRFVGHVNTFGIYSVAQHSVLVARHLPKPWQFAGLMHDTHESITGDIPSPLKAVLGDAICAIEGRLDRALRRKFLYRVTKEMEVAIKVEDLRALVTERRDLRDDYEAKPWGVNLKPWDDCVITPWTIQQSESVFLNSFETMRKEAAK